MFWAPCSSGEGAGGWGGVSGGILVGWWSVTTHTHTHTCAHMHMHEMHVSWCVLEPPVLPADLFVLSPGYKVLPDLATVSPPFSMCSLRSQCPQHQFECPKWRCRHRDVKRIIFSYRNDIMNPYKRSRPDRDAVLWLPTANWTVSHVCPIMCCPGTVPEVLTVFLVK